MNKLGELLEEVPDLPGEPFVQMHELDVCWNYNYVAARTQDRGHAGSFRADPFQVE